MGAQSDHTRALHLGAAVLGSSGAGIVRLPLGPVWAGASCAGPARPARCAAGDNLAVHAAVAGLEPGEVLVVAIDGDPDHGYWGEVLTAAAQHRGGIGLVIEGCVRDTHAIHQREFAAFALGVALPDATKSGPGTTNVPIGIGGVTIEPGDLVVADADGVVVLPASQIPELLARGEQRVEAEREMLAALAAGGTTIALLGLEGAVSGMSAPEP